MRRAIESWRFAGLLLVGVPGASLPAVPPTRPIVSYTDLVPPIAMQSSFRVTIMPDGRATFTILRSGPAGTSVPFVAAARDQQAFLDALQHFRPRGERSIPSDDKAQAKIDCPALATDQDTIDVTWTEAEGRRDHLRYYLGCGDLTHRFKGEALGAAPKLLHIDRLIAGTMQPFKP